MGDIPEYLPFRLVGISKKEIFEDLYVDDEEITDVSDAENIPSDTESLVEETYDSENEENPNVMENESIFELVDSDPEDDVPLSLRLQQLRREKKSIGKPKFVIKWNKENSSIDPMAFSSEFGVPENIKNLKEHDPGVLFQQFFTDDFFEMLVFQTNLYAQQLDKPYNPTNIAEMKTFIAINLLMGIKKLPSYRDFWSSSSLLHDTYISSLLPSKRFSWLLGHLHVNDNNQLLLRTDPKFDKLHKIRPMLDHLQNRFVDCFKLSQNVSIDESMIRFKGRSSLKQYLPKKPIKRGYKVWMLADQCGYCYKFQICTGKTKEGVEKDLGGRVVRDLTHGLENKGHRLFFDNYFTSVPLLDDLHKQKIYACGTIKSKRLFLPKLLEDKQLKRGDFDFSVSNNGLLAVKWMDKKAVNLLSNYHNPADVCTVNRRNPAGVVTQIPCPQLLTDYNKHMNGVDKFDQNKHTYEINRKSHKWWHRIFFYFLDASVVNAFVLHKQLNLNKTTMKNFRLSIVEYLVAVQKRPSKRSHSSLSVAIKKHKPFVPKKIRHENSDHQPKYTSRRRCGLCSTSQQQVRTNWMCSTCNVPLCLGKDKVCFERYHTQ